MAITNLMPFNFEFFLKQSAAFKIDENCYSHVSMIIIARLCLLSFHSPMNFLRSFKSNRFAIAATFGATAGASLTRFLDVEVFKISPEDSTPWLQGIFNMHYL